MKATKPVDYRLIFVVLLICLTAFSAFKYITTLKDKYDLMKSLNQAKRQVAALEELQKALTQENVTLKEEAQRLAELEADLQYAQKTITRLTEQMALSSAENTAIREEKDILALELSQVSQERDMLKMRLKSLPELKKAIKEVKLQIRNARLMMKEIARKRRFVEGNRGYLIKDGKSTYPSAKIKIEVMPAR